MKKIYFSILIVFFTASFFAQKLETEKLDRYFEKMDSSRNYMLSVAIWKNDKVVYTNHAGFSDVENQIKPNSETKYRIGSISKTFTAAMIMKATEEGKLALNNKLSQFFPKVKNASDISIEYLLTHKSGLYNFTDEPKYLEFSTSKKSRKQILDIIYKQKPVFSPGTKQEYSNTNYILLSYILEDVYKKPYSKILEEKIINPLGLKNTFFGKKITSANNEAFSYIKKGDKWKKMPETDMSIPMGAGAIVSTPSDLIIFADALFNGKIIKQESIKQMTDGKTAIRKGLFLMPFGIKKGFGHTGGIDGFTSVFVYFPKEKVGAAITSNGINMNNNNEILIFLLKTAFNIPVEVPDFKTFNVSKEVLEKYVGTYVSPDLPLKISIRLEGNKLTAQATGQSSFILTPKDEKNFEFAPAGIHLKFLPNKNQMILNQSGQKFVFTKE